MTIPRYLSSLFRLVALSLSIVALSACGGSGGSDGDDNNESNPDATPSGDGWAALQGTWVSSCHTPRGDDNIITREFDGNIVNQTVEVFASSDGSCSGSANELDFVFSYEVGSELTTQGGITAREIDIQLEEKPDGVTFSNEQYDIFVIQNDTELYFSDEATNDPQTRPDQLNFSVVYNQQ
ncbi:MAG: hypothetical protein ACQES2_11435 [Pseudomonadota bacterium]